MNVGTGELQALTEQVSALGRKISTLTGRTTVMGNHLNRLDGKVYDEVEMMILLMEPLLERYGLVPREPARRASPKGQRHLRLVK